jgi:hypothetical protein
MIGGLLRPVSCAFAGPQAEAMLRDFRADRLFLAVGFDLEIGLSTPDVLEAQLNGLMMGVSKEVNVVATSANWAGRAFPASAFSQESTDQLLTPGRRPNSGKRCASQRSKSSPRSFRLRHPREVLCQRAVWQQQCLSKSEVCRGGLAEFLCQRCSRVFPPTRIVAGMASIFRLRECASRFAVAGQRFHNKLCAKCCLADQSRKFSSAPAAVFSPERSRNIRRWSRGIGNRSRTIGR